jgi:hypothetical protein
LAITTLRNRSCSWMKKYKRFLSLNTDIANLKLKIWLTTKSGIHLASKIMQVYRNVNLKNEYQSSKLCEALYIICEDKMDQLQVLKLPSLAKFNAGFLQCSHRFDHECVGPSKTNYATRMNKVR